jgi:hypothetical protein
MLSSTGVKIIGTTRGSTHYTAKAIPDWNQGTYRVWAAIYSDALT